MNAAREVMYGTADLSLLSSFDVLLGLNGFADWDEVGDVWTDANWDAWQADQGGAGGWMGSSGHRANIRSGAFDDLGVGYFYPAGDQNNVLITGNPLPNGPFFTYWTQNFAVGDAAAVPLPASLMLLMLPFIAMIRRPSTAAQS